jgi:hypothetical protein
MGTVTATEHCGDESRGCKMVTCGLRRCLTVSAGTFAVTVFGHLGMGTYKWWLQLKLCDDWKTSANVMISDVFFNCN